MSDSKRQLSKFTAIFAGGTMISRVLGLVRDMLVAAYIPLASRDAFIVAFRFPNMLRDLVGEGASNAAFVPVLSETLENESESAFRDAVSAILSFWLLLLGALAVVGFVFMPQILRLIDLLESFTHHANVTQTDIALMMSLTRWIFPYIFFIGLTVFMMGPLFIMKHYSTPSWSPALLNVSLIGACVLCRNRFAEPAYALVVGVWLGGVSQLIVQYIALGRHTGVWLPNFRLRHPAIRASLWLLLPVIVGQAAGEVNKLVDNLFAASLANGSVTALFYANRLVQLPLAMFGIAISAAILPGISRAAARGDFEEVRGTLIHGLRQCFFLICPALVALTVIPRPIVALLFQRGHFDAADSDRTAVALLFYAGGLLCFAWVKVAVAGFYAEKNTRVPVAVASVSMLLNIALNFSLVRPMGFAGLALATTISYSVNFLALYVLLARRHGRLWDASFLSALARITVAGILTGMAIHGTGILVARLALDNMLLARFVAVALPLSAGGIAYLGTCFVLRVPDLRAFLALLRKR